MVSSRFCPGSGSCSVEPSTLRRASMAVNIRPGSAVQPRLKFLLQAAQPHVVRAHVAQYLRRNLVVGVEPLVLFLEINALHVQGLHLVRHGRVGHLARHPRKAASLLQAFLNLRCGGPRRLQGRMDNCRQRRCRGRFVLDLRGYRVNGVRPAPSWPARADCGRREFPGAAPPRNVRCCCFWARSTYSWWRTHLQPEKAAGDGAGPSQEEEADKPEARQPHGHGARNGSCGCGRGCEWLWPAWQVGSREAALLALRHSHGGWSGRGKRRRRGIRDARWDEPPGPAAAPAIQAAAPCRQCVPAASTAPQKAATAGSPRATAPRPASPLQRGKTARWR